MLWLLKRTVSMRRFFLAPKTYVKTAGQEIFYNFTLENFVYQNLCWSKNILYLHSLMSFLPSLLFLQLFLYTLKFIKNKVLTLCMLGTFSCFYHCLPNFFKVNLFQWILSRTISLCPTIWFQRINILSVLVGSKCLQRFSGDDKSDS